LIVASLELDAETTIAYEILRIVVRIIDVPNRQIR
jgi:hypothetical protein